MRVASRAGNPIRRMCTAVAEETPPGPFSLKDPTFQGVLGAFACTYIAVIRWQFKDKALAKEIAAHKAAKEPAAEPVALIGEFIDVLAWFALIPPVLCLVEIIGRRRSSSMVVLSTFFAGTISAAIALLNQAGTESVSAFMSTWPAMDAEHHHDGGFGALQALEVREGGRDSEPWCASPRSLSPSLTPVLASPAPPTPRR